jgi:hypothetical protein
MRRLGKFARVITNPDHPGQGDPLP